MKNKIRLFQVDAFTENIFGGNPAAVCVLEEWLPTDILQKIAAENFVPETAFFVHKENNHFDLRWFTPDIEMDLCGHATLASAHIIFEHLNYKADVISFSSKSGLLKVSRQDNKLVLDFPSRKPTTTSLPEILLKGLNVQPLEVLKARDYVVVLESEKAVRDCEPNRALLDTINLDPGGIIITAKGDSVDFVSRFFTPQASIFEDPVTGSAHCSLIPYWSEKLNKSKMIALQVSARVGKLFCENLNDRVLIGGNARTYFEGYIYI